MPAAKLKMVRAKQTQLRIEFPNMVRHFFHGSHVFLGRVEFVFRFTVRTSDVHPMGVVCAGIFLLLLTCSFRFVEFTEHRIHKTAHIIKTDTDK